MNVFENLKNFYTTNAEGLWVISTLVLIITVLFFLGLLISVYHKTSENEKELVNISNGYLEKVSEIQKEAGVKRDEDLKSVSRVDERIMEVLALNNKMLENITSDRTAILKLIENMDERIVKDESVNKGLNGVTRTLGEMLNAFHLSEEAREAKKASVVKAAETKEDPKPEPEFKKGWYRHLFRTE